MFKFCSIIRKYLISCFIIVIFCSMCRWVCFRICNYHTFPYTSKLYYTILIFCSSHIIYRNVICLQL